MRSSQQGFSYVIVMFMVAVLAIASVRALEHARTAEWRDKEVQLLWTGMAYRNAIAAYYGTGSAGSNRYPSQLEDLLYVGTMSNPIRPLRKRYRDPITGSLEWGTIRNKDGGIIGVFSLSQRAPLKQGGFAPELAAFAVARHYSDWKFVYQPEH